MIKIHIRNGMVMCTRLIILSLSSLVVEVIIYIWYVVSSRSYRATDISYSMLLQELLVSGL